VSVSLTCSGLNRLNLELVGGALIVAVCGPGSHPKCNINRRVPGGFEDRTLFSWRDCRYGSFFLAMVLFHRDLKP
jgi:hypothetical protein